MSAAAPDRRRAFEDIFARPTSTHLPPRSSYAPPQQPDYRQSYYEQPAGYVAPRPPSFQDGVASDAASLQSEEAYALEQQRLSYYGHVPMGPRPLPPNGMPSYAAPPGPAQFYPRPYSIAYSETTPLPQQPTAYGNEGQWLSRRSSESAQVLPPKISPASSSSDRGLMSLSQTPTVSTHVRRPSIPSPRSSHSACNLLPPQPSAVVTASKRSPIVYPALLSKVAEAFKARVNVAERVKDGLSYKEAFDGRDAVDKLAYIIKTTDRNLALLLGRALDAQKFFHDVTYDHRLRDSHHELYQFRERLAYISTDELQLRQPDGFDELSRHVSSASTFEDLKSTFAHALPSDQSHLARRPSITDTMLSDDYAMPSGVFTLLTDCYSPTCTRDRLCYSIACPRRLEQQARLKMKPQPVLKREDSAESLTDLKEPGTLWIHSVPQDIIDSVDDKEKKRQEAINEAIYTERDFVRDVEYLRDTWIKGIRTGSFIPDTRKEDFILQVFWNVMDIHAVSHKLAEQLTRRQKQSHVVHQIGDVYVDNVDKFQPFVQYGAHQLYGKYEFEKEKGSNPAFAKFVEDTERAPESRKLELNAYLTKPTTRLARYPLLLEVVLKYTPEGHPDHINIPKAVKVIREFLTKVNEESGKSENRFNLAQLDTQLVFKPGEAVDLKLRDEHRELIFKGPLKKRGGTQNENAELQVFLFDHALLMAKQKSKNEQYKVYRKPIPLELLIVTTIDETTNSRSSTMRSSRVLMTRASTQSSKSSFLSAAPPPTAAQNSKTGYAMTFTHLGRRGYDIVLWASTWVARKKWLDHIEQRQNELRERSMVFDQQVLSEGYFVGSNRVTCAAPFDAGNRLVFGTDNGVYISDLRDKTRVPIKVISVANVTQVDVLDEYGILIVLADKAVQTFYIDHLDPADALGAAKRARKISSNASFFKAGICMGRTLVCVVKAGTVSSTIKTLEPIEQSRAGSHKKPLRKFLQGSHDTLRVFKEFYLPSSADSIHFLKSKLCVGCVKGFEIVDLETLDTQGLLDPADSSLDFVQKRESTRPIAIYRIDGEFLLCYDEFAFYVNKNGWRTKANWLVQWEGRPTHFALHHPFVLAFEPTFVEVRHVESGALLQIIPGNSLRLLYADTPSSSSTAALQQYNPTGFYYQQQSRQSTSSADPYARNSMYGYPQNQYTKPQPGIPIRPHSQIIFSDNFHQVFKMLSSL